jgi:hypothetical protein
MLERRNMKTIISSLILAVSIFCSIYFYSQSVRYELTAVNERAVRVDRRTGRVWQLRYVQEGVFMFEVKDYPGGNAP